MRVLRDDDQDYKSDKEPEEVKKSRKRAWTSEEDQLLIKLVDQYGPQKWTWIASYLPHRIGKQCRERWHNHLNP